MRLERETRLPSRRARAAVVACLLGAVVVLAAGAGCDDPDKAKGPAVEAGGALYLVQARVNLPEGRVNHFAPVQALSAGALDLSRALEVPGNARLYAEPGGGAFLLGVGETATITRVDVDAGGRFSKGQSLSLAGLGLKALGFRAVTFIDANRALYRDGSTNQVVEIDPTTMTITRAIALPADLARPGYTTFTGYAAVRRGDRVVFPLVWYKPAVDEVSSEVALVTVDLGTGRATAVRDPRCPAAGVTFTAPDGAYFFNHLTSTYADRLFKRGRAGCALRIRAGESVFDPDYLLELGALVAGAPAAAVGWGGAGRLWFRALDEGLEVPAPGTSYAEFFAAPAWRLWRLDVTDPASGAVPTPDASPASCCGQSYVVDGAPYGAEIAEETTTLVDLSGEAPRPTLSARGAIDEVVRLR